MAYQKCYPEGWKDNEEGATPITAASLNNMEKGIMDNEAAISSKQDSLSGSQGQILGFDQNGNPIPQAPPDTGVISFNGRSGAVTPQSGDYSAAQVGAVPVGRKVNGKTLNVDITLSAADVGARPSTWTPTAADVSARPSTWTPSAADVGAVPTTRKVNNKALSSDISLGASDVGAVPTGRKVNGKTLTADISLTAADVGALGMTLEALKDIFLCGAAPYGKELTESWSALQTRIKAGNFAGIHIGDYKTITLTGGEVVIMEVAGIDQYYKCADQEIGHHIDFISRDCLAGTKLFNDTNQNNGTAAEPNPWRASKLFQTLNDATTGVYAKLPANLKSCIIEKRAMLESRYSEAGALKGSTGWAWKNMGKLWVPTEVEVFGNTFWSDGDAGWTSGGGCNLQYPIFIGGTKHIIKGAGNGGGRCPWWEASAQRQSATNVCCVGYDGTAGDGVATHTGRYAPLCFRIG